MTTQSDDAACGEGDPIVICSDITDSKQSLADTRLMSRAVRERWPIDDVKRAVIINRLCRIVDKDDVAVTDQQGTVQYDEATADRNAIAAARVLVAMISQNQRDEQPRQQMAPVVNVGVAVNGNPQSGRNLATAIAERIRTERLSHNAPG